MNLFWKKFFRRLRPTAAYEKQELAFLDGAERYESLRHSSDIADYKKLLLEARLGSSTGRKIARKRMSSLESHPDVAFYAKLLRSGRQELYPTFRDDFYWKNIQESHWQPGFYFSNPLLKKHYSFANEQQAYNEGNNTQLFSGTLEIHTRHEAAKSMAWHPVRGFTEKAFAYTSDVLQTAASFRQCGGIFKAKIRCTGNIHHAFWLGTEALQPHINIFHFDGSEIRMGYVNRETGDGTSITGIDPGEYYIYTLEWTREALVWYINNLEVLRITHDVPWEPLHMVLNSFIPENHPADEGLLEVQWVRAYQFHS